MMERNASPWRNKLMAFFFLVLVGVFGVWSYRSFFMKRDALPQLDFPDVNNEQNVGKVDQYFGTAWVTSNSSGIAPMALPSPAASPGIETVPSTGVRDGMEFKAESVFRVQAQSQVQLSTAGNWIVVLDGDGEFTLDEAWTNESRNVHSIAWTVKKGTFRAKPHDYDPSDHWLEVRTDKARIVVHQGELGVIVPEGGGGRFWLVSGRATVYWKDGRQKVLETKGMGYL